MKKRLVLFCSILAVLTAGLSVGQQAATPATVVKAGRLIDPETGTVAANQMILIEGEKITEGGPEPAIPSGATVIDLSQLTVLPGLVDAHTHMAMTYKEQPENNYYYLTYITDSIAVPGDPGRVERHPAPQLGLHGRPGRRQQRPLRGRRAPAGHRTWAGCPGPR